jgi:hypothetical protein
MQEKTVWIGDTQVKVGDRLTTIDSIRVEVVAIDDMSGKLQLMSVAEDEGLRAVQNATLDLFNPAQRIGAVIRE